MKKKAIYLQTIQNYEPWRNRKNSLGFVRSLKLGTNLSNLSSSPARLLKSSLECSIYYNEKFEWLQYFQWGFFNFYVHHLFLIILF